MRYSASEKYEIIRLVEQSILPVKRTLVRLDIHRSTFYTWLKRYEAGGIDALEDRIDGRCLKENHRIPWCCFNCLATSKISHKGFTLLNATLGILRPTVL